jgi:uncharacterized protein (TIGR02588 family)
MARQDQPQRHTGDEARIPVSEVIGATVGALAALGLIGGLAFEALTNADTPPQLSVATMHEAVQPSETGAPSRVVTFRVHNTGGRTAAEVTVVIRAEGSGAPTETSGAPTETEIVFDFVPRGSTRDGAVVLPPGSGAVDLRIAGYREP